MLFEFFVHCRTLVRRVHETGGAAKGTAFMKTLKLVLVIGAIALALFLLIPNLSWAASDGATVFQTRCAICHGADLRGKPSAKAPSLISDEAKKASDSDLTDMIANGGKDKKAMHAFANKGLSPDQLKMVTAYIREQQKR